MAEKYLLRVTAGPDYDTSTHVVLPINTHETTTIASEHCTSSLQVRVQNYRGLPRNSPKTSPYFSHAPHNHDQYSIAFTFVPHASVSSKNLVFGNDFDRPIRDRLPPGFGTAFKIVKWAIDPGLDGDVYADKPHLYGPALSSLNVVHVGPKASLGGGKYELGAAGEPQEKGVEEGAEGDGETSRHDTSAPASAAERKKWALKEENQAKWEWEEGRVYKADFFNPYLDFNDFSLKLPGFSLAILPYMDGKDTLRYVLKDKETGHVFFVVVFTLVMKEDVEKQEAEDAAAAKAKGGDEGQKDFQPSSDDLD